MDGSQDGEQSVCKPPKYGAEKSNLFLGIYVFYVLISSTLGFPKVFPQKYEISKESVQMYNYISNI